MRKYWALDYVYGVVCELVVDDQLYATEAEAEEARQATGKPEWFEVNWYSELDLEEIYNGPVNIDENLKVY